MLLPLWGEESMFRRPPDQDGPESVADPFELGTRENRMSLIFSTVLPELVELLNGR
jgi:hypothetical protein